METDRRLARIGYLADRRIRIAAGRRSHGHVSRIVGAVASGVSLIERIADASEEETPGSPPDSCIAAGRRSHDQRYETRVSSPCST